MRGKFMGTKSKQLNFFGKVLVFHLKNKKDDAKILFLLERLIKEIEDQGHNVTGIGGKCKYFSVFEHAKDFVISSNGCEDIRLTKSKEDNH